MMGTERKVKKLKVPIKNYIYRQATACIVFRVKHTDNSNPKQINKYIRRTPMSKELDALLVRMVALTNGLLSFVYVAGITWLGLQLFNMIF